MPHENVGSTIYTAKETAERALRKINAFSINDDSAREEDLYEALYWLDMIVAHVAGIGRCFWLVRDELSLPLTAGDHTYDLAALLNQQIKNGVQFPVAAFLETTPAGGGPSRTPLPIVQQITFRKTVTNPTSTGAPTAIFIDRLNGPTLYTDRVATAVEVTAVTKIILIVQTFSGSLKPKGSAAGNIELSNEQAGLRPAWNLWAVTALAAQIGDGPVRTLPSERIDRWKRDAAGYLEQLYAFENREHDDEPPYVQPSVYS